MVRLAMLIGAAVIVFFVVVAIGVQLVPSPRSETDFLVIGSVATLLSLGTLFVVLITTWIRTPDVFFKRRQKPANPEDNNEAGLKQE